MINCTECLEYANMILERGEITSDDINKLAIDRHILKGCDSRSTISTFDIASMDMLQLKDTIKMLVRLINCEHERLNAIQDRVIILESKNNDNKEKKKCNHKFGTKVNLISYDEQSCMETVLCVFCGHVQNK